MFFLSHEGPYCSIKQRGENASVSLDTSISNAKYPLTPGWREESRQVFQSSGLAMPVISSICDVVCVC